METGDGATVCDNPSIDGEEAAVSFASISCCRRTSSTQSGTRWFGAGGGTGPLISSLATSCNHPGSAEPGDSAWEELSTAPAYTPVFGSPPSGQTTSDARNIP